MPNKRGTDNRGSTVYTRTNKMVKNTNAFGVEHSVYELNYEVQLLY